MLDLDNDAMREMVGFATFSERTVRTFKLNDLEDICENYGQTAVYKGTIPDNPQFFDLDDHHRFNTGKPLLVCGNTASMLKETRFASAFDVISDRSIHYGAFESCGNQGDPCSPEAGSSCCC